MLETKHRITIYIIIYNNVDGLSTTVDSVLSQNIEADSQIILSDDGSSNYDTKVLDEYADKLRTKYSDVVVNVNENNVGTVKHLNKVFSLCNGKYLLSCSCGDSFYNKETVRNIVEQFEKEGCLIITSRHQDTYANGKKINRPSCMVGMALKCAPKKLMNYMIYNKNLLSGCSTFYDIELFKKYGLHDEDYHLVEDYPYYIELLRKGVKFGWYKGPAVIHEIGGVSTGRVHPSIYKDIELMRKKLYPDRAEFSKKTRKFLEKHVDA